MEGVMVNTGERGAPATGTKAYWQRRKAVMNGTYQG
jgi:hypothetical protein